MNESGAMFSIGALSKTTGIPVETLRTWERRYGFPEAARTDSGHRRYPADTVPRLLLVKKAMEQGHRPSTVMAASPEDLRSLIGWVDPELRPPAPVVDLSSARARTGRVLGPEVTQWVDLVHRIDVDGLERCFRVEWGRLGARDFLERCAAPFLYEVGELWARSAISVMQEHVASERLRDFLTEQWRPLSDRSNGPRVVCATLSGEHHSLGLHMAATMLAVSGAKLVFLGADTPAQDIARAAQQFQAVGVVVSVSVAADAEDVLPQLHHLRAQVPSRVPIFMGGGGAPVPPPGIDRVTDLSTLATWYENVRARGAAQASSER